EAGFGADLGAEKFVDIKCRKAGLRPSAAVIVATVRALKYHGGVELADLKHENLAALDKGVVNLERHIDNVHNRYGLPCTVAINRRAEDTEREIQLLIDRIAPHSVRVIPATHFAQGGRGAPAHHVVNIREVRPAAGAEFVIMICGDIMTMPGLPKLPAANNIDVSADGRITGLF